MSVENDAVSQWLKRSPPCLMKRHLWEYEVTIHESANGWTTEKTCRYCKATRREFHSNHRGYPSTVSYRTLKTQ